MLNSCVFVIRNWGFQNIAKFPGNNCLIISAIDFFSSSQGEDWWKIRQALNPVMMKPNAMKRYVPKMDEIVNDYLALVEKRRGPGIQMPKDFLSSIYKWALETIGCITFDIRIGLLGDTENEMANKFLNNVRMIFQHTYKLDVLPSIWKWYKTPLFKEAMQNLDELNTWVLYVMVTCKSY